MAYFQEKRLSSLKKYTKKHPFSTCSSLKYLTKPKIAKVISILKSGDKEDENNYRPISFLPAISKIFDKSILTKQQQQQQQQQQKKKKKNYLGF